MSTIEMYALIICNFILVDTRVVQKLLIWKFSQLHKSGANLKSGDNCKIVEKKSMEKNI